MEIRVQDPNKSSKSHAMTFCPQNWQVGPLWLLRRHVGFVVAPLIIATVIVGVAVGRCCYPYASQHLMRINGLTITFMSTIKIKLNRFSEGPAPPPRPPLKCHPGRCWK